MAASPVALAGDHAELATPTALPAGSDTPAPKLSEPLVPATVPATGSATQAPKLSEPVPATVPATATAPAADAESYDEDTESEVIENADAASSAAPSSAAVGASVSSVPSSAAAMAAAAALKASEEEGRALKASEAQSRSDRDEKRRWQMKYIRNVESRRGMPADIAVQLAKGENLFEIYRKNKGNWSAVLLEQTIIKEQSSHEQEGDKEYTEAQLMQVFHDADVVAAMVARAKTAGLVRDHPSAPGCDKARLYTIDLGKERTKSQSSTDRTTMSASAELPEGTDFKDLLTDMTARLNGAFAARPKPNRPNPPKELTEEQKAMTELKKLDGKINGSLREISVLINKIKQFKEDLMVQQEQLRGLISKRDAGVAEMKEMDAAVNSLLDAFKLDMRRVKRVAEEDEDKGKKDTKKAKGAKGKAAAAPA